MDLLQAGRVGLVETRTLPGFLRLSWEESRPVVQLIFTLRFFVGFALSGVTIDLSKALTALAGASCWLLATFSVYVLNGIEDIVEDTENGSTRPIARGDLPVEVAAAIAMTAGGASVVISLLVPGLSIALPAMMLLLGWAYSASPLPLKRSPSGFVSTVVLMGLLTFMAGWQASGIDQPNVDVLTFALAMSSWMALGGMTKDLSDVEGDRIAGRKTWPVIWGEYRSRKLMAIAATSAGLAFCAASWVYVPRFILVAIVLLLGGIAVAALVLTRWSYGNRTMRRRPYRAFMITQYAVHLTLLLSIVLR